MTATTTTPAEGQVRTNNRRRPVLDGWDLTVAERAEFDYIDWAAVERGDASVDFARYKGNLIDLRDSQSCSTLPAFHPMAVWDGFISDSYFSAVCFRYEGADDSEVVFGTFTC